MQPVTRPAQRLVGLAYKVQQQEELLASSTPQVAPPMHGIAALAGEFIVSAVAQILCKESATGYTCCCVISPHAAAATPTAEQHYHTTL